MIAKAAVATIDVGDLPAQTREILRRARDRREVIDIADSGTVFARLIPVPAPADAATRQEFLDRRRRLAEEIGRHWTDGVSAVEAVAEQRRDL